MCIASTLALAMGHLAERYRDATLSGVYRVTDAAVPRAASAGSRCRRPVLILEGVDVLGGDEFQAIVATLERIAAGHRERGKPFFAVLVDPNPPAGATCALQREVLAAGRGDVGRRHHNTALPVALQLRASYAIARRQVRLELGQTRELEERQVPALKVLGDRVAVPSEARPDKEVLVLQPDQRLGHAKRAAEMRFSHERLAEAHAHSRTFQCFFPSLLDAVRREPEIVRMLCRIRTAAHQGFACEPSDVLVGRPGERNFFSTEAQRHFVRERRLR